MSELVAELKSIHEELLAFVSSYHSLTGGDTLNALEEAANTVGRAWSQSWLGYQSRVYYEHFLPPPAGDHFSSEWGFLEVYSTGVTRGRGGVPGTCCRKRD